MATLSARKIVEGGLASSLSTANTGGDEFVNTGIEFVRIRNDHASTTYTVRITAQTTSIKHPTMVMLLNLIQMYQSRLVQMLT